MSGKNNKSGITKKDWWMIALNILTIIIALSSIYINYSQTRENVELSQRLAYYEIPPNEIMIGSAFQDNEIENQKDYNISISVTNNIPAYIIPAHIGEVKIYKDDKQITSGFYISDTLPEQQRIEPIKTKDFDFILRLDKKGEYRIVFSIFYNYKEGYYYSGKTQLFELKLHVT